MKIKNNIKKLLSSIILLCFLWAAFLITQLFSKEPEHKNEYFVPKSSTFAVKLNSKKIMNKALFKILFEGRDEKIIQKIQDALSKPSEKNKNIGIDFLSEVVLFTSPFKNGKLVVASINLTNTSDFKTNIPKLLDSKTVIETIDNVGFILTYLSKTDQKAIEKREILNYFKTTIKPLSNNFKSIFKNDNKNDCFLESVSKGNLFGKSTSFISSDIQMSFNENGINLIGNLGISQNKYANVTSPEKILIPKANNFYFSSGIIPKSLQDSISSFAKQIGLNLPKLKSISMNYGGLNIVANEESITTPIPDIDLLLEFNTPFSISDLLIQDSLLSKIGGKFYGDVLNIGGKKYYIEQVNAKTVSISVSKSPAIISNRNSEIFAIKGDLSSLFKINGGGMIVTILEMIPAYKASKDLLNNLDHVNLVVKKTSMKNAKLDGSILFKKDHFVMTEMMKFILEMQFIFM